MTFTNIVGGSYTLNPTAPINYNILLPCWRTQLNSPTSGTGLTNNLSEPTDSDTLTWDLGYSAGAPWVQTNGGNVYGAGNVVSYIPSGITPRVFNVNGSGGYPGVVAYGSSYDFDASPTSQGANLVSSTNWLVNQTHTAADYYAYFAHKFNIPDSATVYSGNGAQPGSSGVYYVGGDLTTSGNWNAGNGEKVVFLVNGNLTIGENTHI